MKDFDNLNITIDKDMSSLKQEALRTLTFTLIKQIQSIGLIYELLTISLFCFRSAILKIVKNF